MLRFPCPFVSTLHVWWLVVRAFVGMLVCLLACSCGCFLASLLECLVAFLAACSPCLPFITGIFIPRASSSLLVLFSDLSHLCCLLSFCRSSNI